jgi:truncated hemoglobin YjbI
MSSVHTAGRQRLNRVDIDRPVKQEAERVWLRCLAHTLRLEGDYVSAQTLERDFGSVPTATAPARLGTKQVQMKTG